MINSVEAVVQRQLDAYNAKDLDAWVQTYAQDAKQFEFPATLLTSGQEEIRARAAPRFEEPNLNAALLNRTVMGNTVIDYELVTRTFLEGEGTIELTCIYVVQSNKIQTASFIFGKKTLL
jgi:hypothetical protein